jgi:hypothetical protein
VDLSNPDENIDSLQLSLTAVNHLSGAGSERKTLTMSSEKHPNDPVTDEKPLRLPAEDQLAKSMEEIIRNAKSASDVEHKMSLWQGVKLYPKAVAWSLLISTCIAMEGYDTCLLSNFCKSFVRGQKLQHFEYLLIGICT